jgi:methylglutaconyl-CoA hydratase
MKSEKLIIKEKEGVRCNIWLNRTEKGNAFDINLIRELNALVQEMETDDDIQFVVIGGKGKNFCSGADLQWMKNAAELSYEDNLKESLELAELFHQIYYSGKIYLARIFGACYGGGIGLAAACDFVLASEESKFAFSEVRLGLVPATIAPYVVHRSGGHKARQLMLTGETLSAIAIEEFGIVDYICTSEALDTDVQNLIDTLSLGGKRARQSIKQLISDLENITDWRDVKNYTAELLARARSSSEGKEGIQAFLEKRNPNWE